MSGGSAKNKNIPSISRHNPHPVNILRFLGKLFIVFIVNLFETVKVFITLSLYVLVEAEDSFLGFTGSIDYLMD